MLYATGRAAEENSDKRPNPDGVQLLYKPYRGSDFATNTGQLLEGVVVIDVVMPKTDGIELVKLLAESGCNARILVISGYAERYLRNTKSLAEAFGLPSVKTMTKPLEISELESFLAPTP